MNRLEEIKQKHRRRRRRIILYVRLYTSLLFGIFLLIGLLTIVLSNSDDLKQMLYKLQLSNTNDTELQYDLRQKTGMESESDTEQQSDTEQEESKNKSGIKSDSGQESVINQESDTDRLLGMNIDMENLNSPNAILLELNNGKILSEYQADSKVYPASMTKIMTAVLAIENIQDINMRIKLPSEIFNELYAQDASMAGFEPGEEVTVLDLLYGVMLPSGAECCITLANQVSGSEDAFAELMNEKAEELGMKNSHFCNSTGLHEEQHFTTVRDIAVLLKYALENDVFREVFTSSSHSIKYTNKHPEGLTFSSTMFKSMERTNVTGGEILGGKTGYTTEAGLCLASLAKIDDMDYILVTAGAKGNHYTEQFNIADAFSVYNQIDKVIVKGN